MPRTTDYDWWRVPQDFGAVQYGLTPVRVVTAGTSAQSPALVVPNGLPLPPKGRPMETDDDVKNDWHLPRWDGRNTQPPAAVFADLLPKIGSRTLWLAPPGITRHSELNDWRTASNRGCPIVEVRENDENTVWVETAWGLQGYLCTCMACRVCVHDELTMAPPRGVRGGNNLTLEEAIRGYYRTEREWREVDGRAFEKRMIGHIGPLFSRGFYMGELAERGRNDRLIDFRNRAKEMENVWFMRREETRLARERVFEGIRAAATNLVPPIPNPAPARAYHFFAEDE